MAYTRPDQSQNSVVTTLHSDPDFCLREQEAAAFLSISVALLRKWRRLGGGPRHTYLGRLVRYRMGDLRRYLLSASAEPGGDQ